MNSPSILCFLLIVSLLLACCFGDKLCVAVPGTTCPAGTSICDCTAVGLNTNGENIACSGDGITVLHGEWDCGDLSGDVASCDHNVINGGAMVWLGNGFGPCSGETCQWSSYEVNAKMTLVSDPGVYSFPSAGFVFHTTEANADNPDNFFGFSVVFAAERIAMERFAGSWFPFETVSTAISLDVEYDIRLVVRPNGITVFMDGVERFSHTGVSLPYQSGSFGFRSYNQKVRYRDVKVSQTECEALCPKGNKCAGGDGEITLCEIGTYQDELGKSSCKTCPPGYYGCDSAGSTEIIPCSEGHYCSGNYTNNILYQEACECEVINGECLSDLAIVSGTWSVNKANQRLSLGASEPFVRTWLGQTSGTSCVGSSCDWTKYTLEFDLTMLTDNTANVGSTASALIHATNINGGTANQYLSVGFSIDDSEVKIEEINNGNTIKRQFAIKSFTANDIYRIKIEVNGRNIKTSIDDTVTLDYIHPTADFDLGGSIGFASYFQPMFVDKATVSGLDFPCNSQPGPILSQETPCSAGEYQDEPQQDTCKPCEAGSYAEGTGTIQCTRCPENHFSTAVGATENVCERCKVGQSTASDGATECVGTCEASEFDYIVSECNDDDTREIVYYSENEKCNRTIDPATAITRDLKCSFIPFGSPQGDTVKTLIFMGLCVCGVAFILIGVHSKNQLILASQLNISLGFIVGLFLVNLSFFWLLGKVTTAKCVARTWFMYLSITFAIGCLLVKIRLVYKVFTNPDMQVYTAGRNNRNAMYTVSSIVSTMAVLLLGWSIFETPRAVARPVEYKLNALYCKAPDCIQPVEYTCVNDGGSIAELSCNLLISAMTIYCCYISYQARSLPESFSEAKYIMIAQYNLALTLLFLAVVTVVSELNEIQIVKIQAFAVFWITSFSVLVIFGPKFYVIYTIPKDEMKKHVLQQIHTYNSKGVYSTNTSSSGKESSSSSGVSRVVAQPSISFDNRQSFDSNIIGENNL